MQRTPIAIAAISAVGLERSGVRSVQELTRLVPSLTATNFVNSGTTLFLAMRGQRSNDPSQISADGAVGVYLDGFFVARPQIAAFDMADPERVEVLRGPQGTLYGRNTTGGAINLISKKPTGELGIDGKVSYGNLGAHREVVNVNLASIGNLKIKLSGLNSHVDGWAHNPGQEAGTPQANNFMENDQWAGRVQARWQPTSNFTADYSYIYARTSATPGLAVNFSLNGAAMDQGRTYVADLTQAYRPVYLPKYPTTSQSHMFTMEWAPSENFKIRSLTGYWDVNYHTYQDYVEAFSTAAGTKSDTISQDFIRSKEFTQELQFIGKAADGQLHYTAGLYFFREHANRISTPTTTFILAASGTRQSQGNRYTDIVSKSYAAYGQLTWTPPVLGERLDLTVGGRYTHDVKDGLGQQINYNYTGGLNPLRWLDFNPLAPGGCILGAVGAPTCVDVTSPAALRAGISRHNAWSRFNPAATIAFRATPDLNFYAKVATGYKAGGYAESAADYAAFDPEKVISYELGMKSEWLDHTLRFNITGYLARYSNLQTSLNTSAVNASLISTINLGRVTVKGLEADLNWSATPDLVFSASGTYGKATIHLDAPKGTVYDPAVNAASPFVVGQDISNLFRMTFLPKWTYTINANWTFLRTERSDFQAFMAYTWRADDSDCGACGQLADTFSPAPQPGSHAGDMPSYGLLDARLTWNHKLTSGNKVSLSVFGKNITDTVYPAFNSAVSNGKFGYATTVTQRGAPRTYGVELGFDF